MLNFFLVCLLGVDLGRFGMESNFGSVLGVASQAMGNQSENSRNFGRGGTEEPSVEVDISRKLLWQVASDHSPAALQRYAFNNTLTRPTI